MEDNNKDDNNDDKGISALGLDRDLGFSRTSRASAFMMMTMTRRTMMRWRTTTRILTTMAMVSQL